jgi:CRISPR-associated protein Cas2
MKWVIAYDIEDDGVRDRIARILLRHGKRVQESVFECRLDDDEIRLVSGALGAALGTSAGDIRFYRLCRTCQPLAFGLGPATPLAGESQSVT